jgi:hypothetical protein
MTVTLTEEQVNRYDLNVDSLTLDKLVEKIKLELTRDALRKCQAAASEGGLDLLTMDDINAEIRAVREAKNRR